MSRKIFVFIFDLFFSLPFFLNDSNVTQMMCISRLLFQKILFILDGNL